MLEVGHNYKELPKILNDYEEWLSPVEDQLRLEGKSISEANRENPSWQVYYDQRRCELASLVKQFEGEVKRATARLYKSYKENSGRNIELNEREILKWIENEPTLVNANICLLEVKEIYGKYDAVVNAFQTRGYALNNITKARVAGVDDLPI